jgi:serine/threonine-protein phosphatase 2A regulatory subunit A
LEIASVLGAASTKEHIVPMVSNLIKNSSAEIRLVLLKNFEKLRKVVGFEVISSHLSETIKQLTYDKRWRIRMNIVDHVLIMARVMEKPIFQDKFESLYLLNLDDNAFAVREATIKNLKELAGILGVGWIEKYAFSKLLSYNTHTNYLYRLNPLFAIALLAPILTQDFLEKSIAPFVLNQIVDKIPNIRFNVAKCLRILLPLIKNASLQSAIEKALSQLAADPDSEVKYYASLNTH